MKLNRKKIIAKEFLILIGCVLVYGLAYLGTLSYNHFVNYKVDKLEKDSQPIKDSIETLSKSFSDKIDKQKWFFDESDKLNATGSYTSYKELWERIENLEKADSIQYKWDNAWSADLKEIMRKIGFSNGHQFEQFIESNSLSADEINQNNSVISLNNDLDKINSQVRAEMYKIIDADEKTEFALACLLLFAILLFPLRYLFYAIRWSIKTLKQKE